MSTKWTQPNCGSTFANISNAVGIPHINGSKIAKSHIVAYDNILQLALSMKKNQTTLSDVWQWHKTNLIVKNPITHEDFDNIASSRLQ